MPSWRQIARKAAYWTMPAAIFDRLRARRPRTKLTREVREVLARNRELRDRHGGERCFILATGPSIGEQDLRPLADERCIAVSTFAAHEQYDLVRPEYYCLAPIHEPYTAEDGLRYWSDIAAKAGRATFFLGARERRLVEEKRPFPGEVYYVFLDRCIFHEPGVNVTDLALPLPQPRTVTMIALSVAMYLGFREICLLGCDHSWPAHVGESRHFHREEEKVLGAEDWGEVDLATFFSRFAGTLEAYKCYRDVARRKGVRVVNGAPGGYLDVFERVDYEAYVAR